MIPAELTDLQRPTLSFSLLRGVKVRPLYNGMAKPDPEGVLLIRQFYLFISMGVSLSELQGTFSQEGARPELSQKRGGVYA
jgi:hypothetical protein